MPTPSEYPEPPAAVDTGEARRIATSFGSDAERYDHARPDYPDELITRILAGHPGADVLDVGCGTGLAARQFQAAGRTVLGVEPDARMADFARDRGLPVEVATFETWEPGDRSFDVVTAAQSWHWVDPVAGPAKAAAVLRPGGRLAIFGHVFEPPAEVAEPFAAAFRRVVPESPFSGVAARRPLELYESGYRQFADRIRESGSFGEPEQWRFDWQRIRTREQWLEFLPTTGGLTRLEPDRLAEILAATGDAIDSLGGSFTMDYITLALVATRI
jgi:SAM-dependent methyltransferase